MFKSTLRLLSLIVLPHPELPSTDTETSHRSKWKKQAQEKFLVPSNITLDISVAPLVNHTTPPILATRSAVASMTTSTPRKIPSPMSLDVAEVAAYSPAVSRRRYTLCICPEHCPPGNISPSETFWTCPPFSDSAISPLHTSSIPRSSSSRKRYDPPSPSPRSRFFVSYEAGSPSLATTPDKHTPKGLLHHESSPSQLTPCRSLRRSVPVSLSPSTKIDVPGRTGLGSPTLSQPRERNANNRRRSDGNSQTHSRLFELELSPILEDTHVIDTYFGPAAPGEGGRIDGIDETSSSDSETSESSFGEVLEVQTAGSVKISVLGAILDPSQANVTDLASSGKSVYQPSVPVLTLTSPTPETLQSVIFSDTTGPNADEHEGEGGSANLSSPSGGRSYLSGFSSPISPSQDTQVQVAACNFLRVPMKEEGRARHSGDPQVECARLPRHRPRIMSRAWNRLSRMLILPRRVSVEAADNTTTGSVRGEALLYGGSRRLGTVVPARGVIDQDEVGAQKSNSTVGDTDPRRRSFGIPTLVRRRLAERHGNLKRYTIPF